eukprot:GHUV01006009.1.p1 GENE.GHUV01006009.1~~GHUV01006009.1.p1  ORF type:complete len:779 (+),score=167.27 GHUV01006009.1:209-2338(+)
MNGAAPGRASASALTTQIGNLNVTARNGPVCYTPPVNSPSRAAAAAAGSPGQAPGAAPAAVPQADGLGGVLGGVAAVGNAQYVAAMPPPPPQQQQPGSGISAIFRNATSTLLEVGEPRVCSLPLAGAASMGAPAVVVRHDGFVRRDRLWRGAGLALPVFAARTRHSVGVGEFLDLIPLVDFASASGMRMVQVLPVNDTCVYNMWWDSYPYSTLSVHALHPQYLALRATVDDIEGASMPPDISAEIENARVQLDGPDVDYEGTMATKKRLCRKIFDAVGHKTLQTQAYKDWFAASEHWVVPYAAFSFLRDLFGTAEHWRWGVMAKPSQQLLQDLTSPDKEWHSSILCCYWVQYQLHRQLRQVSEYAASKRVVLKGDLPIGVDKRSVDTWMEPHLFRMDKSTGSPPDFFDPNGQNWGFPTYNWEAMAEDDYLWWRRRLGHLSQYFHAYRIDHILGFCRIWEIPGDCATGMLGYFRPSIPITAKDLEVRGMSGPGVLERLTEPYVTKALLKKLFGPELALEVSARYFIEGEGPGGYRFRPEYYSEKVLWELKERPGSPDWLVEEIAKTRKGLLTLRQNLILVRDPEDPQRLYPRFGLMGTSSYKELPDAGWRSALSQLHDDYFYKRHDALWRSHALKTLPAIMAASDMLICGEDLGFVPNCLPPVMQELGLIGLRIQRMPTGPGIEFNNPATYSYLSVASPSCHDVSPLRQW